MLSPLNEGISRPSKISVGLERGLHEMSNNNDLAEESSGHTLQTAQPSSLFSRQAYLRLTSQLHQLEKAVRTLTIYQHQTHLQEQLNLGLYRILYVS
jgi:hypothetical protein